MSGCTKHGHQYDCAACVREQFAETLAEASIKRLKLAKRIDELGAELESRKDLGELLDRMGYHKAALKEEK